MARKVGEIRIKLAAILREFGLDIEASKLWIQEGAYRHPGADASKWGCFAKWLANPKGLKNDNGVEPVIGCSVEIHSYDRMTYCVKKGIEFRPVKGEWGNVEVMLKG